MIEMMDGEIGYRPHGKGSCFWFNVPLQISSGLSDHNARLLDLSEHHVLCVSPCIPQLSAVLGSLSSWRASVDGVARYEDAWIYMEHSDTSYDLVLIDATLEESACLIQDVKLLHPSASIIMLTPRKMEKPEDVAASVRIWHRTELKTAIHSCIYPHGICSPEPTEATEIDVHPLNVLLAEDNDLNRHIATLFLERLGHKVHGVNNGEKVLEAITKHNDYDVILMDVQMPVLDGLATTEQLRATGVQTPIIALTANAMQDDKQMCLAAGMDDFIPKPLEVESLANKLQYWGIHMQKQQNQHSSSPGSYN